MEDFEYKTVFSSIVKKADFDEKNQQEITASLNDLKGLAPYIDIDDSDSLVYIVGNLAVAGMVNLNDDVLSREDALNVYKKFERQQCNIEHNREKVVGYIIKAGLAEVGTDRIIGEFEARNSNVPFYITTVAVLWKVVNKELCDFILEASDPESPDYEKISLSFEVGFTDQYIAVVPDATKNLDQATAVYKNGGEEYNKHLPALKSSGGSGRKEGFILARVLAGKIVPLGQGLVGMPAADVKGVTAVTVEDQNAPTELSREYEDEETESVAASITQQIEELNNFKDVIISSCIKTFIKDYKTSVSPNIHFNLSQNTMDLEKELNEIVAKVQAAETAEQIKELFASNIISKIAQEIAEKSEALEKQKQEAVAQTEKVQADIASLESAKAELEQEVLDLQAKVNEFESEKQAEAAAQAFQDKVEALNAEFDLDDEVNAFVLAEVKDLDEEAFQAYLVKARVVMKEKTKAYKDEMKAKAGCDDEKGKDSKMKDEAKAAQAKADEDEAQKVIDEALASASTNVADDKILNNVDVTDEDNSISAQVKKAFGGKSTTIGGKSLEVLAKKV